VPVPAERFDFRNVEGQKLAALLDRPDGVPRAVALLPTASPAASTTRRRAASPTA
jgi:hypothetical protein